MSLPALPALVRSTQGGQGFPKHPRWTFVFVNHLTIHPFFFPTRFGAADAAALLNVAFRWTGSARLDPSEMIAALEAATRARAAGIAVAIAYPSVFDAPVERALNAGIPVVSYNSDAPRGSGNKRLAYIGQDLFRSGERMGKRIVRLVGRGDVALFISAPGELHQQPRIDGAVSAIRRSGKPVNTAVVTSGPSFSAALARIDAYGRSHRRLRGMFAADAQSTAAVGLTMKRYGLNIRGVRAGGYDLLPETLRLVAEGHLDFTIDQQPYLQGFYPVVQLFLHRLSGGLVGPADTNTGSIFITRENVKRYVETTTRYEGSSSKQKYPIS